MLLLYKLFFPGVIKKMKINIKHTRVSLVSMCPGKSSIIFSVLSQSTCSFVPAEADLFQYLFVIC